MMFECSFVVMDSSDPYANVVYETSEMANQYVFTDRVGPL